MRKYIRFGAFILIILSLIILVYLYNTHDNFDTNLHIINKVYKDINVDIGVSIGHENSSTQKEIFSVKKIRSNSKINDTVSLPNLNEDFGLVLSINDSTTPIYYTSNAKLQYIDIDLNISNDDNGNVFVKGSITSKSFIGTKKTEQIKLIKIKGETNE